MRYQIGSWARCFTQALRFNPTRRGDRALRNLQHPQTCAIVWAPKGGPATSNIRIVAQLRSAGLCSHFQNTIAYYRPAPGRTYSRVGRSMRGCYCTIEEASSFRRRVGRTIGNGRAQSARRFCIFDPTTADVTSTINCQKLQPSPAINNVSGVCQRVPASASGIQLSTNTLQNSLQLDAKVILFLRRV
jgi:hypothetical protein